MELDYSLYPDREIPTDLTDAERAEYVERLCRQFDFGTPIASRFVVALRDWKDIWGRFPILNSPAYHSIRAYFHWERFTPRYGTKIPAGNRNGRSRTSAKDDHGISRCERRLLVR